MQTFKIQLLLILAFPILGCGGEDNGIAPVSGTVFFKGKPLPNATVNFSPKGENSRGATGTTDKDGKYRLTSFQINDGAKIGKYSVTIRAEEGGDGALKAKDDIDYARGKLVTPKKYSDSASSGLTAEIAKKNNIIDFQLTE